MIVALCVKRVGIERDIEYVGVSEDTVGACPFVGLGSKIIIDYLIKNGGGMNENKNN